MMKTIFLSFMIILLTTTACAGFVRGPFSGKVIDAETRAPIEGAVVLVVWDKAIYGGVGGPSTYFLDAKETLTDKEGIFYIEKYYGFTINPLARVRDMDTQIIIYKPGYCAFPSHMYFSKMPNSPFKVRSDTLIKLFTEDRKEISIEREQFVDKAALAELLKKEVVVVELPKLKAREERLRNMPSPSIPYKKQKLLIKLINEERKNLGLEGELKIEE